MSAVVPNIHVRARTVQTLLKKLIEVQNLWRTTGPLPLHSKMYNLNANALCSWLLTIVPTLVCSCNPVLCRACLGKTLTDHAGVGLAHRAASEHGQAGKSAHKTCHSGQKKPVRSC